MIFNKNSKKLYLISAVFVVALVIVICGANIFSYKPFVDNINFNTAHHQLIQKYMQSIDWEISNEPIETEEVIIPREFDNVYTQYNEIQKRAGFNLEDYTNSKCTRYTYSLKYFDKNNLRANILVLNDKIIGGDICTIDLNGFMIPLKDRSSIQKDIVNMTQ